MLLELCTGQQLVITNTIFQKKDRPECVLSPNIGTSLTYYIFVHKYDLNDVIHTKVMSRAEYHSNHGLVCCKLRQHFKSKPRKGDPTRKSSIWTAEVKADFQAGLQFKPENSNCPEDPSPETLWDQLKSTILHASEEVLGLATKKNKDWFAKNNQEIQELLVKKRSSHEAHLAQLSCPVKRAAFHLIYSILQHKLWEIQNVWWTNLAKRTQQYADLGDYRGFYKALKAVYSLTHWV